MMAAMKEFLLAAASSPRHRSLRPIVSGRSGSRPARMRPSGPEAFRAMTAWTTGCVPAPARTLAVTLRRKRGPAYFAVWAPESEQALFFGPSAGNRFAAPLSVGGEYRVRVFMMRSAARRGQRADYGLSVRIR